MEMVQPRHVYGITVLLTSVCVGLESYILMNRAMSTRLVGFGTITSAGNYLIFLQVLMLCFVAALFAIALLSRANYIDIVNHRYAQHIPLFLGIGLVLFGLTSLALRGLSTTDRNFALMFIMGTHAFGLGALLMTTHVAMARKKMLFHHVPTFAILIFVLLMFPPAFLFY